MLYVTTGNSYSVPHGYCVDPGQTDCTLLPADAHIDSIVALNLKTGKVTWVHHTLTADTWTLSEPNASPDFDFGAGPNLYTATIHGEQTDVLGAGQKNGMYYALDPATGKLIWATQAGPGGVLGGIAGELPPMVVGSTPPSLTAATRHTRAPATTGRRRLRAVASGRLSTRALERFSGRGLIRRVPRTLQTDSSRVQTGWCLRVPQGEISMPWTRRPARSNGLSQAGERSGRAQQSWMVQSTGVAAMTRALAACPMTAIAISSTRSPSMDAE
jgi:hypothetical protein